MRSAALVARVRNATGLRPARFALTGWGHTAKVNDLKPLFGLLFADVLRACEWWVTMQDDSLLGSVRSFLTADLLARHDLVSPLPAPFYHNGPFMAYRNSERVNNLWRRSADWRWVLEASSYSVFDEWWGPATDRDNMPRVVHREAAAGRVRVVTPTTWEPGRQRWMIEDFVFGPNGTRWFDESLAVVWRRGRLWSGKEAASRGPCDELLYAHFMHSKRREQVAGLPHSKWLSQQAQATDEIVLTADGFWLKAAKASSKPSIHWLVSGRSPNAVAAVGSTRLRRYLAHLAQTQPADTVQPVPESLLALQQARGQASVPSPPEATIRTDWLLSHHGTHAELVPCTQAIRARIARGLSFTSPCEICAEIVALAQQRLATMRTTTCADAGGATRPLSELLRLSCRSDASTRCAASLDWVSWRRRCGASAGPARIRSCPACASVSVARGVADKSCCHVPGGGWAERCGEAVGERSCGDDGLQPCAFTWLEGWQACNVDREAAKGFAAVRSTIGFADGWAVSPAVHDPQAFATTVLGATGSAAAGGAEVPLSRLAAFAHSLPMVPCVGDAGP